MRKKKREIISKKACIIYLQIFMLVTAIFVFLLLVVIVSAQTWPSADYCCEKTTYGAWCQNTRQENCAQGFRKTPSSCDATSFCKPGCCYDSSEGLCMENTPQRVCNDKKGTWGDSAECQIPQCDLGCCVIDNQAALVTLVRCKKLSGFYGVESDFRTNIKNEVECIAVTQTKDRGACVYEENFVPQCKFTTREDCSAIKSSGNLSKPQFNKDYLCSAEEIGSICGPTSETICIPGKDEVYFKDSCGNPANIYDASKLQDKSYWKKVIDKSQSCGAGNSAGNANSASCGNCDYYFGSLCQTYNRGEDNKPLYGNNICRDLNCKASETSDKEEHKHGESWCSYDGMAGEGRDPVGSRHYRHLCVAGKEIIEACEDYRKEVCIEKKTDTAHGVFNEAACRANRWKDCAAQKTQKECENDDKRDCYWLKGFKFPKVTTTSTATSSSTGQVFGGGLTGKAVESENAGITGASLFGGDDDEKKEASSGVKEGGGLCLPNVPPGLKFWEEGEGEASSVCMLASSKCIVSYEKGFLTKEKCKENCECLEESWALKLNQICASLGDCGGYINWQGKYTDDGYTWTDDGKKKTLSQELIVSSWKAAEPLKK